MASQLLSDVYTGPDGKSWALGRIYSAPVLAVGLAYPIVALCRDRPYGLHDLGLYLVELGGAVLLFVRGHNSIDDLKQQDVPHAL